MLYLAEDASVFQTLRWRMQFGESILLVQPVPRNPVYAPNCRYGFSALYAIIGHVSVDSTVCSYSTELHIGFFLRVK
jgi:hypothetical protein